MICRQERDVIKIIQHKGSLFWKRKRFWNVGLCYADESTSATNVTEDFMDVFVSFKAIPACDRKRYNKNKTMWLDIEKNERSFFGNDCGEEVVLFFRRHGIKFFRISESN